MLIHEHPVDIYYMLIRDAHCLKRIMHSYTNYNTIKFQMNSKTADAMIEHCKQWNPDIELNEDSTLLGHGIEIVEDMPDYLIRYQGQPK